MKIKHEECGNIEELPEGLGYKGKKIYCNQCETYVPSEDWQEVEK